MLGGLVLGFLEGFFCGGFYWVFSVGFCLFVCFGGCLVAMAFFPRKTRNKNKLYLLLIIILRKEFLSYRISLVIT